MSMRSDRNEEDVKQLSEWINQELPNARKDRDFLQKFLTGCKSRQEVARNKLRNWYLLRQDTPEWFKIRDPHHATINDLLATGVFIPMPVKDDLGRTVIVVRATLNNPSTCPMNEVFKVGIMIVDLLLELDSSICEEGVVVVIDIDKVSAGHAMQLTPRVLRNAVYAWQDCYPIRVKAMHFVNCPLYVDVILSVLKSFMRDKLRQRISTYRKNFSAGLLKTIPAKCLPCEYGGNLGNLLPIANQWQENVKICTDWFLGPNQPLSSDIIEKIIQLPA